MSRSPFHGCVSHARTFQAEWEAELASRLPLLIGPLPLGSPDRFTLREWAFAERLAADAAIAADRRQCRPLKARQPCALEQACVRALKAIAVRRAKAERGARTSAHDFPLTYAASNATFSGESNRDPAGIANRGRYLMSKTAAEKLASGGSAERNNHEAERRAAAARKPANSRAARRDGIGARVTSAGIAESVLIDADRPMHISLIAAEVIARAPGGLYQGKTPDQTIAAQLAVSAKKADGVFVRTEPGCFGLRAWTTAKLAKVADHPRKPAAAAPAPEVQSTPEPETKPATPKPARKRAPGRKSKPAAVTPGVETGSTTPTAA